MENERVYNKINYQTNFTKTNTFAILLRAVKENSPVESEYARSTLFPKARSDSGMRYDPNIRDTHGEITLKQYGLIDYVDENHFKLSALGNRFLELFNEDNSIKENNDYNYVSTLIDCIFSWTDTGYGRNLNVGVLLFRLLLDTDLDEYITAKEWSIVAELSEIKNKEQYEYAKNKILNDRKEKKDYPLKKADVLLGGYAGSWKILDKKDIDGETRYSLSEISKSIIIEKLKQIKALDNLKTNSVNNYIETITPEWFKSKEPEFLDEEKEAKDLYHEFRSKYGPETLKELHGENLLKNIFLGAQEDNMCHDLEYSTKYVEYFGSIKGGNAYKYPLFFDRNANSWQTGTYANKTSLSLEDAIKLGEDVISKLIKCCSVIKKFDNLNSSEDYVLLYSKLYEIMPDYIDNIWVSKYFHMIFDDKFPTFYNAEWQIRVLKSLKIEPPETSYGRIGKINEYIKKCNISSFVFNRIFHKYGNILYGRKDKKDMIVRTPRTNESKVFNFNTILYGAPGTGKTYAMPKYAVAIIENLSLGDIEKKYSRREDLLKVYNDYKNKGQIVFTTFHQSYGYEDFIEGLKPDIESEDLKFKYSDGVFKTIADNALESNENYVIIIDEINRGNISKIFGELITLIEDDKRWGEPEQLDAILPSGRQLVIPNNLFILGTMNSADKSISLVDAALRRRFCFIEMNPDYSLLNDEFVKFLSQINKYLFNQLRSKDLLIGHSYFINKDVSDFADIVNQNIIPLLYEYFYDDESKVKKALDSVTVPLYVDKKNNKEYVYEVIENETGRIKYKVIQREASNIEETND